MADIGSAADHPTETPAGGLSLIPRWLLLAGVVVAVAVEATAVAIGDYWLAVMFVAWPAGLLAVPVVLARRVRGVAAPIGGRLTHPAALLVVGPPGAAAGGWLTGRYPDTMLAAAGPMSTLVVFCACLGMLLAVRFYLFPDGDSPPASTVTAIRRNGLALMALMAVSLVAYVGTFAARSATAATVALATLSVGSVWTVATMLPRLQLRRT